MTEMTMSETPTPETWMLETRQLTRQFSGFTAVNAVDLKVRRNTIHALIGPNGAGKTTCFNLITKFLKPTSGTVILDGEDITDLGPARVARLGMVRSFQISATFPQLSILQNIQVALQRQLGTSYCFWRSRRRLDQVTDRAMQLLDDVGLSATPQAIVANLPYGQKRALEIATTLALDPQMILLDEPTAGMGREDIARITALIRRIAVNRTILMVEHNLAVVSELSDRITVLSRGEILAEGSYAAVSADARVVEAYMGKGLADA